MAVDPTKIWDDADDEPKQPGVTAADIAEWEDQHGLTLPKLLRELLALQDGGMVQHEPIRVLPLDEMVPPDEEFWNWTVIDESSVRNREWVITFAWGDDEPQYLLNFNAGGPHGEPTVYSWYHDPGDMALEASSLAEFFGKVTETFPTPAVDWDETTRLDVVLFHERIDFGENGGDEYILGRQNGVLVLYERDLSGQTLSRTAIPEPIATSIEECSPSPCRTYGLNLEPEDPDGILSVESTRMSDGTWKNRTEHGVPVYATVESRSRKALDALRETLVGKAQVTKENRQEWWWTWVWTPLIIVVFVVPCLPCIIPVMLGLWALRLLYRIIGVGGRAPQSSSATES
jgi:hypothetical protein